MCSIIAFSGEYDKDIIEKIAFNSRVRGLHSFGYSFALNKKVLVKKFLKYNDFLKSLNTDKPDKFIAHFRYSTSGDYLEEDNNQPLILNNKSLVFNGVIDMGTKKDLEKKYNCTLNSSNDGEISLIEYLKSDENLIQFIKNKTFAGAFLSKDNIKVIRNTLRPCYIGENKENKIVVSTKDIAIRSGLNNIKILKQNTFYEI